VAEARRAAWCLLRLWDFSPALRAFEFYPPLEDHVSLTAETFVAGFA